MTYLAACLEDAARLAEGRGPAELSALLGEFGELMLAAVEAEQGFPGRGAGDQIEASWGGLALPPPQAALRACKAALRQLATLSRHPRLGPLGLRVFIGIAEDDPGLCAELCRLCPSLEARVLVSPAARELCAEALRFEEIFSGHRRFFKLLA